MSSVTCNAHMPSSSFIRKSYIEILIIDFTFFLKGRNCKRIEYIIIDNYLIINI